MLSTDVVNTEHNIESARSGNSERLRWIDISKGICMLSVIAGHLFVDKVNAVVFAYHLTVFFILSGYMIKERSLDKVFIQRRFISYMKPYFITCFFVMIFGIFNLIFLDRAATVEGATQSIANDLIRSFFASGTIKTFGAIQLPSRIGAIWFFPALLFGILFIQAVIQLCKSDYLRWCIVLGAAVLGIISAQFLWLPFSIQAGMLASVFILAGFYAKKLDLFNRITIKLIVLCLLIFGIGIKLHLSIIGFVTNFMPSYLFSSVIGIAASIIIVWISMKIRNNRFLSFVGRNSMFFLCVHLVELDVFTRWYDTYIHPHFTNQYVYAGLLFTAKVIVISIIVQCILVLKKWINMLPGKAYHVSNIKERNYTFDIMKSILIIVVLVDCFAINATLRQITYSCNMIAFIVISGYFYKERNIIEHCKKDLWRLAIPYCLFVIGYLVLNAKSLADAKTIAIRFLVGMSYSKNILQSIESVGIVYFIPMLICIKLLYRICTKYFSGYRLHIVVLALSGAGYYLGLRGFWLPWSFDIAMYSLVFFHIGQLIFKYNILSKLKENYVLYFAFSTMLAFYIFSGSMELAIRLYGDYIITILGTISGFILLYFLSDYIANAKIFKCLKIGIVYVGQSTMVIILFFGLFGNKIIRFVNTELNPMYIYSIIGVVLLTIIFGVIINNFWKLALGLIKIDRDKAGI